MDRYAATLAQANDTLANPYLQVCDRAGLQLAMEAACRAHDALVLVIDHMVEANLGLSAVLINPDEPTPAHGFDDPHYSKVVSAGTAARYRQTLAHLVHAIAIAEHGIAEHHDRLRKMSRPCTA